MNEEMLFVLAGNRSYQNRGCEAITRGTIKILRAYFNNPRFVCLSHFDSKEQHKKQCLQEEDGSVLHLDSIRFSKYQAIKHFWRPDAFLYVYRHLLDPKALKYQIYSEMLPYLDNATAVLSVGGDNYSLDYGIPSLFTSLDDIILEKRKNLVIWGASIGPFGRIPDYEKYMAHHLQEIAGIFARESTTINYLKSIGVTKNVHHVADPAFLMDGVKPENSNDDIPIDKNAIGINLSPLIAKYISNGDIKLWAKLAASIIEDISLKTEMSIYLIPHVTNPTSDDYQFLQQVQSLIQRKRSDIILVSPRYNAAEMKWIISQMALFAGSRTHSTIAALSSGVPTLSFGYSIKAKGINKDIFSHARYSLEPNNIKAGAISKQIDSMLNDSSNIKKELAEQIPRIKMAAISAGLKLKYLIEDNFK